MNWNDLRFVLALHRGETLTAAAHTLGVSDTTVARRVAALEHALGLVLFQRDGAGRQVLTADGRVVLAHAERIEGETRALDQLGAQQAGPLTGIVRISAVPVVTNRILVPALPNLLALYPGLTVELVPESRNLDLTKREADLALRLSRPVTGGLKVRAVKLGALRFGVFAAASCDAPETAPWITYEDGLASLPQARWMAARGERFAPLRVSDAETAHEAAAQGMGRTVLPLKSGCSDPRLRCLSEENATLPERDVWLLSHADQGTHAPVVAAKEWLGALAW